MGEKKKEILLAIIGFGIGFGLIRLIDNKFSAEQLKEIVYDVFVATMWVILIILVIGVFLCIFVGIPRIRAIRKEIEQGGKRE